MYRIPFAHFNIECDTVDEMLAVVRKRKRGALNGIIQGGPPKTKKVKKVAPKAKKSFSAVVKPKTTWTKAKTTKKPKKKHHITLMWEQAEKIAAQKNISKKEAFKLVPRKK